MADDKRSEILGGRNPQNHVQFPTTPENFNAILSFLIIFSCLTCEEQKELMANEEKIL